MTTTNSLAASRRKRDYKELAQLHVQQSLPSDPAMRNLIGCLFGDIAALSPSALNFRSELLRRLANEISLARRRAMNRFKTDILKKAANVLQLRKQVNNTDRIASYVLGAWAFECMPAADRAVAHIDVAASMPNSMLLLVSDILTQTEKGGEVNVDDGEGDIDIADDDDVSMRTPARRTVHRSSAPNSGSSLRDTPHRGDYDRSRKRRPRQVRFSDGEQDESMRERESASASAAHASTSLSQENGFRTQYDDDMAEEEKIVAIPEPNDASSINSQDFQAAQPMYTPSTQ